MIRKLLIANRGEIAVRIMRTAHRLGVSTVAVYSDADAGTLHVEMADEAVRLGPAPVADSYLRGAAIIEAAHATGADAVHPGYGFLSENPDFAEAVAAAGLVFVGPPAPAIRAMGLKDAAKAAMKEAGVPVVPGYHGENQDPGFLAERAEEIGYPVLIKAVAGGGGKGMRRVERGEDFAEALKSARSEAKSAFGNEAVLIEKFIAAPRHIEMQVFGDATGGAVHLFERDCSLQRRHQKVIEEAPAPGMTDRMRAAMGRAAVDAAKAIGYVGAGTVEFIVDGSEGLRPDRFWFMEMNTRLQVEHPVTEAVTGIDLVEWQLRVAAGEALPLTQDEIGLKGHAVEARLYAEDAGKGFLPATGRLSHLRFPDGLRADSGVRAGDEISPYYDPMIAKLVATGPTRGSALAALARGLAETEIAGSVTNLGFLARLVEDAEFRQGRLDTGLIERKLETLTAAPEADAALEAMAILALLGLHETKGERVGFHLWTPLARRVIVNAAPHLVEMLGPGRARVDGVGTTVLGRDGNRVSFEHDGRRRRVTLLPVPGRVTLMEMGQSHIFQLAEPGERGEEAHHGDHVAAPMPGLVKDVRVKAGQNVVRGEALLVLEAMKMEHVLTAPRDGEIAEVLVDEGAQVAGEALLVALKVDDG